MRSARFENKPAESKLLVTLDYFKVCGGFSARFRDSHKFPVLIASSDKGFYTPFIFLYYALQKRDVFAAASLFFYLRSKAYVRAVVFCHNQKPGSILVDTVDYPRAQNAVYAAERIEMI